MQGCGYNTLQSTDEQIKASWSEVLNQYQRRADLVPNLVNVVKGYAAHEKDVLTQVTEARAKVGSIQATPELINDEQAFAKFQAAQGEMTSALSRLLAVSENYPQLKADGVFRDLAGATGRHRKPHHRGTQPLHQGGAGIQRDGALLPQQSDRHDVRLQDQAEFHGGEREGNFHGAQGGFWRAGSAQQ